MDARTRLHVNRRATDIEARVAHNEFRDAGRQGQFVAPLAIGERQAVGTFFDNLGALEENSEPDR